MRIDLGNEQWAEVKELDELRAGDRRAVSAATKVTVDPETREISMPGDYDELQRNALLCQIVTAWSLGIQGFALPSKNPKVLDALTNKQIDALYKGTEEHLRICKGQDDNDPSAEGSVPTGG